MALDGRWVAYGRDAAEALRDAISAAKGPEPLAPVTVVVASNQVGVSLRRQLAGGDLGPVCGAGPGLVAVTFATPYRVAELLGAPHLAGEGRRPVSTPVITAAVRAVLADRAGLFEPVAGHPATEAALVASYRELRDLREAALDGLTRTSARAAEVVRIQRAVHERLRGGWYDEEDLMAAAAASAREQPPQDLGSIVVFLPQRLSRHSADLLAALGEVVPVTVLAGSTGHERADAEVAEGVARAGLQLGPSTVTPLPGPAVHAQRTRIVTVSDADEEAREAVRAVVGAVRDGVRLDRLAVLHGTADPYDRLLREQFAAAGIATNGPTEVSLAERVVGRVLLDALALPAGSFRRQDVFAWLSSAPILHQQRFAPATAWERISREAGVVRGVPDWNRRLEAFAQRCEQRADELEREDDAAEARIERQRANAARARELRAFVLNLAQRFERAAARPRGWDGWVRWTRELWADLLGGAGRRDEWPVAEQRAADRLELALERLRSLDQVEPEVGLEVFARTLRIELEADSGRVGRFGEGVLVAPVAMGVGLDLDLLVVVGLAEGTFPAPVRDDSLLPDAEREATGGELPVRAAHLDRSHRWLLASLAGARSQVLCVPRGDLRRSSERVPSRWVLDVAAAMAGTSHRPAVLPVHHESWAEEVPSFSAGLARAAQPATAQEHRLRALLALPHQPAQLLPTARSVDPDLARAVELLAARSSHGFTRFDGNLAGLAIPSPTEKGASATSLERWAACPHRYFVQDLLRVEPVEQPEEQLQITPLDRGSLVHEVLERFVLDVLNRPDADRPGPHRPWADADLRLLLRIGAEVCDEYEALGVTGHPLLWRRDRRRILAELETFLAADDDLRASSGAQPVAAELEFGMRGAAAVAFPLPDGRAVPMRGKADRVDAAADGTIHVLDYKTGKADAYKDLKEDEPHQRGTRLQLAVYGLAARQHLQTHHATVHAHYWFVSQRGGFARHGYLVTDAVLERVGQAMQAIVDGIEGGVFLPHPVAPNTSPFVDCHYCDPDGLGTGELHRQWSRKVATPELAGYAVLAELADVLEPTADEAVVDLSDATTTGPPVLGVITGGRA